MKHQGKQKDKEVQIVDFDNKNVQRILNKQYTSEELEIKKMLENIDKKRRIERT